MNYIALNAQALPDTTATLPEWLPLIPAGTCTGRDGRTFHNSAPGIVLAYNRALNRDIAIDLEHASEIKAPKGEPAPAVGWIKALDEREGAIWGRVEWNSVGAALISNREYRYYSPAIVCDQQNHVLGIQSVGLTNKHNLQLPALNQQQSEDNTMPLSAALRQSLGLSETATDADAVVAIEQLKSQRQTALNAQARPSPDEFMTRADYDLVVSQLNTARTELNQEKSAKRETEITALVDQAVKDKQIAPASREHHVWCCRQEGGIEQFKAFLKTAPPLLDNAGLDDKTPQGTGRVELNTEQKKINAMFGNSPEDFTKYANA